MSLPPASILGALVVVSGGFLSGSAAWPMKLMKRYQFEHWWFVAMLTGLIVVPWTVTLVCCPNALKAYSSVPWGTLVTANLWNGTIGFQSVRAADQSHCRSEEHTSELQSHLNLVC